MIFCEPLSVIPTAALSLCENFDSLTFDFDCFDRVLVAFKLDFWDFPAADI
jgi:hypothetical protein